MKTLVLSALWLTMAINAFAQFTIKGVVTDNNHQTPIEGVTVSTIAGPQHTVVTDKTGRYQLTLPQKGGIRFSHVGYISQTVHTYNSGLNIALAPATGALTEVVVVGFQNNRKLLDVAGALNVVKAADLQTSDNSSIATALNAVPGVRMEEQSPGGSTRISIRGSVLRSPFGVRGIKVYWNDIPYTSAGGNTPYALFEPAVIGNIEIIKGPAGSIYGAGTGGVIIMSARKPAYNEQSIEVSGLAGSYGLRRYGISAGSYTGKVQVNATYNEQWYDGYRSLQSCTYRKVLSLQSTFHISDRHTVSVNAFNTRSNFDLPGALTKAEFERDPRYVDPMVDTLDGRVTSAITNVAVSNQYKFSDQLSNTTALYTASANYDHPFGTSVFNSSYGRANTSSLGGRTRFTYTPGRLQQVKINFGAEFQRDLDAEQTFTNEKGKPGEVTGLYDLTSLQYFFFANAEINLPKSFFLTLGASYNRLNYKLKELYDRAGTVESKKLTFKGDISPRIALLKKINPYHSVFASVSTGFGPPTPIELSVEGRPNTSLRSERGTNYEIGARGRSRNGRFQYDVNVYQFNLRDIIIASRLASGAERYDNSGSARQRGAELLLNYAFVRDTGAFISGFDLFGNFTYNDYKFDQFILKDEQSGESTDFGGLHLPGIPGFVAAGGFDISSRIGLYLNGTYQNFGSRYITNDNKERTGGYDVANIRIGYKHRWNRIGIHVFTGINNLFDEKYSEFLAINGFGGRYYLPSPPANYYGGMSIKYSFNQ